MTVVHTPTAVEEPIELLTPSGTLRGTLQVPGSVTPVPVVLIHAGSGPTDRDGNSAALRGKNNSLKQLAEALAARGIASVRYDKRGIGESASAARSEAELRFDTYVDDAAAWVERLRSDKRFSSVTILGHSEGSLIGILAAQRSGADALVSVAGPGRPAGGLLREQLRAQLPPALMAQVDTVLTTLEAGRLPDSVPAALAAGLFRPSVRPYLISWLRFDPAAELAKLNIPVLVLQGTTDIQVSPTEAQALARCNPRARVLLLEGVNHVLKTVSDDRARQLASYSDPSLPIAPELVEVLGRFVAEVTR